MNPNTVLFQGSKRAILLRSAILISVIGFVDWRVIGEVALGFLYLIPMLMIGSVASPSTIAVAASVCTYLAERFGDLPWNLRTGASRVVLHFAAFVGAGLFIREINKSRRAAAENLHEIERERDARRDAEEQLKILFESSPVAIITADSSGTVLMANEAAHRMLELPQGELVGRLIHRYLPALTNITMHDTSLQLLRAVMQARGQREDGETFLADICFSTYRTNAGVRLAAMVLDASEDLRAHEVAGMHQLLEGSRIAVSALSHEIRNVCGAIAVVHQNLKHAGALVGNKDFEALGSLVVALEHISSVNLRHSASQATEVDLTVLLDELKIVVAPTLEEEGIESSWSIESGLPLVWADRSSLMQVFLNLISNSTRALSKKEQRTLSLSAKSEENRVYVEVVDNGGGVVQPEHLFRPFQAGAEATGLGLYMSRSFLRSFGGELRYAARTDGACFIVELQQASGASQETQCMKFAY
ncbi:MAG TPA: ATP-binding protein [Terracidiphilus sp.]|jgi:two-component system, LuxR family, sensor kinase FixL|nr:ATP-binding protein [Terracidiphilus sp.]